MRQIRKIRIIKLIGELGVVGIIRTESVEKGIEMGTAMIDGGLNILEVSLTYPGSLKIIEGIAYKNHGRDFILGTGTVGDAASARTSILSGAEFIVSHSLSEEVVVTSNRYGVACFPGVQSVSEAVRAMELGCDVVKIFPGSVLGPAFIKAVHGPLPHLEMIPVGGVTSGNLKGWFDAGAYAVGLGSDLTRDRGLDADYDFVRVRTETLLEEISSIRRPVRTDLKG